MGRKTSPTNPTKENEKMWKNRRLKKKMESQKRMRKKGEEIEERHKDRMKGIRVIKKRKSKEERERETWGNKARMKAKDKNESRF